MPEVFVARYLRIAIDDADRDRVFAGGDLARAVELMNRHGSLRDTVERAKHYGAIARDALGIFPDHPIKRALLELVDFSISRGY